MESNELEKLVRDIHDRVSRESYNKGADDFAKWLIEKKPKDYTDIVDLVWEFKRQKTTEF